MAAWPGWETQLLGALRITATADAKRFLDDWQRYEGGTAANNPLNTTQTWPGATTYNSVGVKNYRTQADGIQATMTTLQNGRYEALLKALRSGNPYTYGDSVGMAAAIRTWGTGTFAAVFSQQTAKPQKGAAVAAPPGAVAPRTHSGYADLKNSVGRHLPTQVRRSKLTGAATLRLLAHRHKVGR